MATWVNERCHKCRHSFTGGHTPIREVVGPPFLICPKCSSINNRESSCTEWLLMPPGRRAKHYATAALNVLVLSVSVGLLISIAWAYLGTGTLDFGTDDDAGFRFLLCWILGLPLSIWRVVHVHRRLVRASAERLRDEQYRSALVRLGYMRAA